MPRADELGKALNLLIHDLRAPLGVAHGYLRLLKEHRLSSADEEERAIAQSLDALGRVSRLCTDASAYLAAVESDPPKAEVRVSTADLTARTRQAVETAGLTWIETSVSPGSIRVTRADIVASAVADVLRTVCRTSGKAPDLAASARIDGQALCFVAGTDAQRSALFTGSPAGIDPWRGGHGIILPLACLQLAPIAGSVWTTDEARPGIGVALPLEVATS